MPEEENDGLITFCDLVLTFGSIPIAIPWRAFVFAKLWAWFAVPLFNLPPLGIAGALGVLVILAFLESTPYRKPGSPTEELKRTLGMLFQTFFGGAISLGLGFLVHHFLM